MKFVWLDYNPATMGYVEDWLDADAIKSTGLDDGFQAFYDYWINEEDFIPGENFWCKVVFENDIPLAVIAFCQHKSKLIIMELIVTPQRRGQHICTHLLKEMLENISIIDTSFSQCEAVIFPNNLASRKAFVNAGFQYVRTHEDGSSILYAYQRTANQ